MPRVALPGAFGPRRAACRPAGFYAATPTLPRRGLTAAASRRHGQDVPGSLGHHAAYPFPWQ